MVSFLLLLLSKIFQALLLVRLVSLLLLLLLCALPLVSNLSHARQYNAVFCCMGASVAVMLINSVAKVFKDGE